MTNLILILAAVSSIGLSAFAENENDQLPNMSRVAAAQRLQELGPSTSGLQTSGTATSDVLNQSVSSSNNNCTAYLDSSDSGSSGFDVLF